MAKLDRLNEGIIFELCDLYELDYFEEVQVLNMYHKTIEVDESISVEELLKAPERPKVPDVYAKEQYVLTKGTKVGEVYKTARIKGSIWDAE